LEFLSQLSLSLSLSLSHDTIRTDPKQTPRACGEFVCKNLISTLELPACTKTRAHTTTAVGVADLRQQLTVSYIYKTLEIF